jgi:hypothetical protein
MCGPPVVGTIVSEPDVSALSSTLIVYRIVGATVLWLLFAA